MKDAMRAWIFFAVLVFDMVPTSAFGQLYLITGAPTPQDSRAFGSALFQVSEGGLKLVKDLSSAVGTDWIGVAYDLRKAVILSRDWDKPKALTVIDLDKAAVTKECLLPYTSDASIFTKWLISAPGKGPVFEWILTTGSKSWLKGMILDPSVSCEESFPTMAPADSIYIEAHGTSGLAEVGSVEGTHVGFDQNGKLSLLLDTKINFECDALPAAMRKDTSFGWMIINNSRVLVVGTGGTNRDNVRALVFRKHNRTWHVLQPPGGSIGNLRGFGKFISIVEARTKKAIASQLANYKGAIYINEEVRVNEVSAGRAEWRKIDGEMGPNMEEAFASAQAVYPGRLHLYNVDSKRLYTKVTNQGDSEVLLVEGDTMYYRVSDRLYSAPITNKGIGDARLLATSESIRDAHWAFIKH
jgi:hypothetical protein